MGYLDKLHPVISWGKRILNYIGPGSGDARNAFPFSGDFLISSKIFLIFKQDDKSFTNTTLA